MAYSGGLGEDGYVEGGETRERGLFGGGGEYGREGYGRPGYGGEGYGREGYGREGYGGEYGPPLGEGHHHGHHGRPGYAQEEYGREGYGMQQPQVVYVQPQPVYVEAEASDLGMGLQDAGLVDRTGYGGGYGRSEVGYGGGYGGYEDPEKERLREELKHEKRRAHEAELAAVAAGGYGLHERHEKRDDERELERFEPQREEKHHHRLFGL